MQQSVTIFSQPKRVSCLPLASSVSPDCLEGRAQLRGVAHSHNGPHFHPNATVHSINLSARIRHSPSFLVLIFFHRKGYTRRVLRLSEPGDGLDKPVWKGVRSDGRQVHSRKYKHFKRDAGWLGLCSNPGKDVAIASLTFWSRYFTFKF